MRKAERMNQVTRRTAVMLLLFFFFTVISSVEAQAAPKINKKSITLLKGSSYTLRISGTKNKVNWKTSKKAVAKLTSKKKTSVNVKAVKVGKATVTAKLKGKIYKCNIKVVNPGLSKSKLNIALGSYATLKVNGGSGNIKWESSNKTVATVSGGKVTAIKKGTVKITAIQNGKKMTCSVTVLDNTQSTEDGKKLVEKKIWVVTQEACEVITPVYEYRDEWECSCGFKSEDLLIFTEHQEDNWTDEHARSKVNTIKTQIDTQIVYYEEQGYWKTIYVYE